MTWQTVGIAFPDLVFENGLGSNKLGKRISVRHVDTDYVPNAFALLADHIESMISQENAKWLASQSPRLKGREKGEQR